MATRADITPSLNISEPIRTAATADPEATALLLRTGRPREALYALDSIEQPNIDVLILRGRTLVELGRPQEAAGAFFASTLMAPDNAESHLRLALCLQKLREWEGALRHFERARLLDPANTDASLGLGAVLLELGRAEQALEAFNAAMGRDTPAALLGKAVALQMLRRFYEADAAYREVLRLRPDSEDALGNLVALSMKGQDRSAAAQYAKRLLAIRPDSRVALEALVACAIAAEDYEAAVRYCSRIIEIDPHSIEAWTNLKFSSQRVLATLKGAPQGTSGAERRSPGA